MFAITISVFFDVIQRPSKNGLFPPPLLVIISLNFFQESVDKPLSVWYDIKAVTKEGQRDVP